MDFVLIILYEIKQECENVMEAFNVTEVCCKKNKTFTFKTKNHISIQNPTYTIYHVSKYSKIVPWIKH